MILKQKSRTKKEEERAVTTFTRWGEVSQRSPVRTWLCVHSYCIPMKPSSSKDAGSEWEMRLWGEKCSKEKPLYWLSMGTNNKDGWFHWLKEGFICHRVWTWIIIESEWDFQGQESIWSGIMKQKLKLCTMLCLNNNWWCYFLVFLFYPNKKTKGSTWLNWSGLGINHEMISGGSKTQVQPGLCRIQWLILFISMNRWDHLVLQAWFCWNFGRNKCFGYQDFWCQINQTNAGVVIRELRRLLITHGVPWGRGSSSALHGERLDRCI